MSEPRVDGGLAIVIALLWSAALIHVVAAIGHLDEYVPAAVFFELLAAGQFLCGVALYRAPSSRLLKIAACSSLAVVALWAVTRTSGIPVGPHPGTPEAVGPLDIVCSADELALALAVGVRLGRFPTATLRRVAGTVVGGGSLFLVLLSSLVLAGGGHAH